MSEPSAFPGSVLTLTPNRPAASTVAGISLGDVLDTLQGMTLPSMTTPLATNVNDSSAIVVVDPAYLVERRVIASVVSQLEHLSVERESTRENVRRISRRERRTIYGYSTWKQCETLTRKGDG